MQQLLEMFKEKYGYYPMPDDSNPPQVIIDRLKSYIFTDKPKLVGEK